MENLRPDGGRIYFFETLTVMAIKSRETPNACSLHFQYRPACCPRAAACLKACVSRIFERVAAFALLQKVKKGDFFPGGRTHARVLYRPVRGRGERAPDRA